MAINVGLALTTGCRSNDNLGDFPGRTYPMRSQQQTESGSIQQRLRPASAAELDAIPWLNELEPEARKRVEPALVVANVHPGELLCRVGGPPNYWFGVIDGLLKMSNDRADGGLITYSGLPPGGWFG